MMQVRDVTVHLEAERIPGGALIARRIVVVDVETGEREQLWPRMPRPVLSVPALKQREARAGETVFLRG